MDLLLIMLLSEWLLEALVWGIRGVWLLLTVVSLVSLTVVVSHLVPRKEY